MEKLMKFWPLAAAAVAIITSVVTAQIQIGLNKAELADLSESVDENEEAVEELFYWVDG